MFGSTGRFELYTRSPQARTDARTLIYLDYTKANDLDTASKNESQTQFQVLDKIDAEMTRFMQ